MDGSDSPPDHGRDALGRFAAGNPGRRAGSRNKVSARVVRTLLRDFEANQVELLVRLRRWHLPQYAQMISRLLPRDGAVGEGAGEEVVEAIGPAEAAVMVGELRAALDAGGERLAELEALLETAGGVAE
jgi:hypothetical protein